MRRVVILGRGGAGKSTLARRLADVALLPLVELDLELWDDALVALPHDEWTARQHVLAAGEQWIMDGDLGPYDVVAPRLRRADTVVVLDLPLWRCAWRAVRRGRERRDFWTWTLHWRRRSRPHLLAQIAELAPRADLVVLRTPAEVEAWLARARR